MIARAATRILPVLLNVAMRGLRFTAVAALVAALVAPAAVGAQIIETPEPFDTQGRIAVLTPALQVRLGLTSEQLGIAVEYREARLYRLADGNYVLVATTTAGANLRAPLTADARASLRTAVDAALATSNRPVSRDDPSVVSSPARGAFVVNQALLGLLLYGPAAAATVGDGVGSGVAYLGFAGGTFFYAYALSQNRVVTRAQNHLSWHGARRGAALTASALYALGNPDDEQAYAAAVLAGGLTGATLGLGQGIRFTDAEAHAMTWGSTLATVGAIGLLGTVGQLDAGHGADRVTTALATGAAVAGYPLGLRYARRSSYTITAGDVGTMVSTALIGAGVAGTVVGGDGVGANVLGAGLAAGALAGAWAGDRILVRAFDYTTSESTLLRGGTFAGGLLGAAIVTAVQPNEPRVATGLITTGALLGAMATHALIRPFRTGEAAILAPERQSSSGRAQSRAGVTVDPTALGFAAMRARGVHPIVRVSF